jgi:Na+/H+ antiporter NhaC
MGYSLIAKLAGYTVEGWTFTVISVWFIGGVQMLSIGIVGEYIGKIYNEVKARPRYIVEKEL